MQLTVSKITAYFEIVVNTKLKAAENDANRQKRLDEGKDVYPMSKAEKVGEACSRLCHLSSNLFIDDILF